MFFYDEPLFHIYFGAVGDAMFSEEYLARQDHSSLLARPKIKSIVEKFNLQRLLFLHQVHGVKGLVVSTEQLKIVQPFAQDGDYLITKYTAIGLGIITADCLPVICFDKKQKAIGIAHAGWRGALAGVVDAMVTAMHQAWQTCPADCIVFFGPSAGPCCYRVGTEFQQYLEPYPWMQEVLKKKAEHYFFDLPLFVVYQLQALGIKKNEIYTQFNMCTICNDQFYSHRRGVLTQSGSKVGRQMTIVALK